MKNNQKRGLKVTQIELQTIIVQTVQELKINIKSIRFINKIKKL